MEFHLLLWASGKQDATRSSLGPGVWGEAVGATSIFVHKTQMHRSSDFLPKYLM